MKIFSKLLILIIIVSCSKSNKNEFWIYTSLYKDTIKDLSPILHKKFPNITFKWYQAGSEDISTKVNAEILTDNIKANLLMSADRFWYHELGNLEKLLPYKSSYATKVPKEYIDLNFNYINVSFPIMVMAYNSELTKSPPKSFKDLAKQKWKNKITSGSPLSSGTNFTTMAMLQNSYGWDYIKKLKSNNIISQGGNSSVIRRLQNGQRAVGWVLLENLLRIVKKDKRIKIIYPEDGVIMQTNIMAIPKQSSNIELSKKIYDWFFSDQAQKIIVKSHMYPIFNHIKGPIPEKPLKYFLDNSFAWDKFTVEKISNSRMEIKEKYTEIMFK